jgi:tripartite-type tricarboxylate transporter receptor subunit TctC
VVHDPGYDPIRSFAPVAHISDSTTFLATRRGLAARSVSELIAYARAHPGQLNYASAGTGNQTHLVGELFRTRTATDIVHVPYKSGGEMLSALLAEQVDLAFIDVSILLPLLHEGRLNALAALSTARHPLLPDVPTMAESGFPDFVAGYWTGLVAPAGTPAAVIQTLNRAVNEALRSPEVIANLRRLGASGAPGTPEEFGALIASDVKRWAAMARKVKISAN